MKLSFVSHNAQGRRFSNYASWMIRRSRVAKRLKNAVGTAPADVYALQELYYESEVKYLAKALGYKYEFGGLGVALVYNPKFTKGRAWRQKIDRAHQTLIMELTFEGETINVVSTHLPPFATSSAQRAREAAFKRMARFMSDWNDVILVGLDANWRTTFEPYAKRYRYLSARVDSLARTRANYRTNHSWTPGAAIDYVLVKGRRVFKIVSYVLAQGYGSDHHMIVTVVETKISVPTN